MVPATGFEPARPAEDFGFKDRCVYHSTTRALTTLGLIKEGLSNLTDRYQDQGIQRYG